MLKLNIDTGLKEFEVNGKHVLSFSPSDPAVYNRLMEISDVILEIEDDYEKRLQELETDGEDFSAAKEVLTVMKKADSAVKEKLRYVFGEQNDFDEILDGVNIMAVAGNGERVITNLLNALTPIIQKGMEDYAEDKAQKAVDKAKLNREQRRAAAKSKRS